ncbi:hypothetical protein H4R34_003751 [Dimargaris verticillata]|uniref:3-oxo-5-alpha-steroid 4-dehydrogenase C-terminal domain-containing protein n=1 Tax=Dimargaris verticillata TaxID=2761393 RepID=A0A9W8B049_9FUNG|nr:hypothetical protein H4R34_003751 [Dimargaris verticillata]
MITSESQIYQLLLGLHLGLSVVVTPLILWFGSPYGKLADSFKVHWSRGNVTINGTLGWVIMETVSLVAYTLCFTPWLGGPVHLNATTLLLAAMWVVHYINRSWVYPLRNPHRSPMHVGVMLSAVFFNVINGYVNGRWVSHFGEYPADAILSWHGLAGLALFVGGLVGNVHSDNILMGIQRSKRQKTQLATKGHDTASQSRYVIPRNGLFEWVSSPHYLCELLEWTGYAIATRSTAAWLFVLFAMANLGPRAIQCHRWYKTHFANYPPARKAIIPYLL